MYNVSNLDAAIAFGGFGAGLVVGCLNNVRKTGSLFKYRCDRSKNVSFVVQHLEVNRDSAGQFKSYYDMVKPKIWNPFMPLEHLAPLTLIIITQVYFVALSPGATVATTAILATTYTFKIIVLPITLNAAIFIGSIFLRSRFYSYARKMGIDPSGHALAQSASVVYKLFTLSILSSLNLASSSYRMISAVTTLSDYLWTYQTSSNYHSVMDMAVATTFMSISFGAVYASHQAFVTYAPRVLRLLIANIPIK